MSEAEAAVTEAATTVRETDIDVMRVMDLIPHRYPFLLVDRIEKFEPNVGCVGLKNVTINEPFFAGHFPQRPVMPGVLIIESMAQTAGCLVVATLGAESEGKLVYFMTIDNARFRKPVVPGDQMRVHVKKIRNRGPVWKFEGVARVDGAVVAEATYSAMILDR
ncbi:MAG: 3-hydroxyacyl-ACP dehydratase FabZ [Alphaproteobacteria bacterium]|nr:3-hydroxyacyl-ACP dehydratase FabZ [Alphaproteobacteria bacterium]